MTGKYASSRLLMALEVELSRILLDDHPDLSFSSFARCFSELSTPYAAWQFHTNRVQAVQPDGTLLVSFLAGERHEMAFHFTTWGDTVEVLKPPELRERLVALGAALVQRHGV